ncbi:MAG: glycosyltransferase family 4 protein [Patescibacteria group bacterium]
MKICLITNNLKMRDGWGSYSHSLALGLLKDNIEVCVLTAYNQPESNINNLKIYNILPPLFVSRYKKLFYFFKNYFKIKKVINNCDLIHITVEPYSALLYPLIKNKPYVITAHGTYAVHPLTKKYLFRIYKKVYEKAKKIICISQFTQKKLLNKLELKNTCVIPNGVDLSKFIVSNNDLTEKEYFQFFSVGVLIARKGYHLVISALGELKQTLPDFKFKYVILGRIYNQKYYQDLLSIIKENNLEKEVVFKQDLEEQELTALYQSSDLFILLPEQKGETKFEGFGLVYLEAMAVGLPVLASINSATEEFIKDKENGFLVEPDIEKIYLKIKEILDYKNSFKNIIYNGLITVKKFDWDIIIPKYIEIYESAKNS